MFFYTCIHVFTITEFIFLLQFIVTNTNNTTVILLAYTVLFYSIECLLYIYLNIFLFILHFTHLYYSIFSNILVICIVVLYLTSIFQTALLFLFTIVLFSGRQCNKPDFPPGINKHFPASNLSIKLLLSTTSAQQRRRFTQLHCPSVSTCRQSKLNLISYFYFG